MDDNATYEAKMNAKTDVAQAIDGDAAPAPSGINGNTLVIGLVILALIYYLVPMGGSKPKTTGVKVGAGGKKVAGRPTAEEDDEDSWTYKLKHQNKRTAVFFGSQTGTAQEYALKWAKEARSKFGLSSLVLDPELCEFNVLDKVPKDKAVAFFVASYGEGEPTDNAEVSFWLAPYTCMQGADPRP